MKPPLAMFAFLAGLAVGVFASNFLRDSDPEPLQLPESGSSVAAESRGLDGVSRSGGLTQATGRGDVRPAGRLTEVGSVTEDRGNSGDVKEQEVLAATKKFKELWGHVGELNAKIEVQEKYIRQLRDAVVKDVTTQFLATEYAASLEEGDRDILVGLLYYMQDLPEIAVLQQLLPVARDYTLKSRSLTQTMRSYDADSPAEFPMWRQAKLERVALRKEFERALLEIVPETRQFLELDR